MLGIFLDTETSGLNPQKHSLLELAYKVLDMETGELKETYSTVLAQSHQRFHGADPNSLKINGFTWKEVEKGLPPAEVAEQVVKRFDALGVERGKAVFLCQNPSFDRAFFSQLIDPDLQEKLNWPYHWLDLASMYWAKQITRSPKPWETGVSKDKISEVHKLPPEAKPHRAMNGVNHLLACYEAVVGFPGKSN